MTEPITPSALALRLHQTGTLALRLDLAPNTTVAATTVSAAFALTGDAIEFCSLAERNRIVAEAAFAELHEQFVGEPDQLFEQAHELWRDEIGHPDQASGRLLALAARELDVVDLAAGRIRRGEDVFGVLHLMEAALPHLQTLHLESLIDLCIAKHETTRNDLAGGAIHAAIESWFAERPQLALELRTRVLSALTEATATLLCNAVMALSRSAFTQAVMLAKADAGEELPICAGVGVWTLGRLLREGPRDHVTSIEIAAALSRIVDTGADDLRRRAIRAATGSLHMSPLFDTLLKRLAGSGDQAVLAGIAETLFLHGSEMIQRDDLPEWLSLLTGMTPDGNWGAGHLDQALAGLLTSSRLALLVPPVLTNWTARHGQSIAMDRKVAECFPSTCEKLARLEAVWSALLTDWLLSDDRAHAANLAGMMSMLSHVESLHHRLDKGRLEALDAEGLLFLARRMLGYVHDRQQVTELALSILAVDSPRDRVFPVLRALLVNEIGYDYPGSTIKDCKVAASGASIETRAFLFDVADAIEKSLQGLEALPRRKELRPPARLRREFARARAKQMNQAIKDASKNSVWRQIAVEIPIKAGRGTFQYRNEAYGASMQLSSFSHSIEMPRREVFDPVGNSIRLLGFRVAKRGEK